MSELVIAYDVGAGSLRAGAVALDGSILASAAVLLGRAEPAPGWSELDPERWWRAISRATAKLLDALPRSHRVIALTVAGLTRCQILLDAEGRVLRPAILFRDRRAENEVAELALHLPAANPADAVTAFHPLARLAWLAKHEAEIFRRAAHLLEPKDYLNYRLTGLAAADAVSYSRFDSLGAPTVPPEWLARCLSLLAPQRLAPWQVLGEVACREPPFDRLAGVPVFAGAMDAWAAAVGAGAAAPGQGYDISGTSEVVGLVLPQRRAAPGLVSLVWTEDAFQLGGPTQLGADAINWCHDTFRLKGSLAAAVERAGALEPDAERPLFLPYLEGERAPLWRSDLRGAFHGIARRHGAEDFLWSVLEGVAQSVRHILAVAETAASDPIGELCLAGGGARSDAWCQLKADVVGVPARRSAAAETGLVGAAMAAFRGLGLYADLAAAAAAMCRDGRVFAPRRDHVSLFAERAARYAEMRRQLGAAS